jgi:hypothetical protein
VLAPALCQVLQHSATSTPRAPEAQSRSHAIHQSSAPQSIWVGQRFTAAVISTERRLQPLRFTSPACPSEFDLVVSLCHKGYSTSSEGLQKCRKSIFQKILRITYLNSKIWSPNYTYHHDSNRSQGKGGGYLKTSVFLIRQVPALSLQQRTERRGRGTLGIGERYFVNWRRGFVAGMWIASVRLFLPRRG